MMRVAAAILGRRIPSRNIRVKGGNGVQLPGPHPFQVLVRLRVAGEGSYGERPSNFMFALLNLLKICSVFELSPTVVLAFIGTLHQVLSHLSPPSAYLCLYA